ncbi:uncharacterized protein BJ171DRAFT_100227, partial [Polychytrium aggregatum]|uniref:uncharacterized protein n=1 Tax=Polychytrium aggregatum TaxID=110093 RepID=UPI0022FE5B93
PWSYPSPSSSPSGASGASGASGPPPPCQLVHAMSHSSQLTVPATRKSKCNLKLKEYHRLLFKKPYNSFMICLLSEYDDCLKNCPTLPQEAYGFSWTICHKGRAKSANWTIWVSRPILDKFLYFKKISLATSHAEFVDMLLYVHIKRPVEITSTLPYPCPNGQNSEQNSVIPLEENERTPDLGDIREMEQYLNPEGVLADTHTMSDLAEAHVPPYPCHFGLPAPVTPTDSSTSFVTTNANGFNLTKEQYEYPLQYFNDQLLEPFNLDCTVSSKQTIQTLPTPSDLPVDAVQYIEPMCTYDHLATLESMFFSLNQYGLQSESDSADLQPQVQECAATLWSIDS